MLKHKHLILLACLFLCAVFLRSFAIEKQGLFHYDEGRMVNRASQIWGYSSLEKGFDFKQSYVDSKMLWLFFIVLGQAAFGIGPLAAQIVSILFGLATVILVYYLAVKFYDDRKIGLLSVLFLSFSFLHVAYSRMALPESTAAFLAILSFYLCLFGTEKRKFILLAGLVLGFAFLTNRFRVILFLFFCPFYVYSQSKKDKGFSNILVYLSGFAGCILLYLVFIFVLNNSFGYDFEPLWLNLSRNVKWHSQLFIEPQSFAAFFYYIFRFEGFGILLLVLGSVFFVKSRRSTYPFVLFVFVHIFLASFVDEKPPRALSVVLPFISIICAVTLYSFYERIKEHRFKEVFVIGTGVLLLMSFARPFEVLGFRSSMPEAMQWIKEDKKNVSGVLSTSKSISLAYSQDVLVGQLDARISGYKDLGYTYMILEPSQYLLGNYTGFWKKDTNSSLFPAIQEYCTPLREYPHLNKELLDLYLFEHARPSFKKMYAFVKMLPEHAGRLVIYEVGPCFEAIKGKWKDPFLHKPVPEHLLN